MRLDQALSLARYTRLAFLRVSDPDRMYRCPEGRLDDIEGAFMPQWEYILKNETRLRLEEGDGFEPQPWRRLDGGWTAAEVMADDWVFENEERP